MMYTIIMLLVIHRAYRLAKLYIRWRNNALPGVKLFGLFETM